MLLFRIGEGGQLGSCCCCISDAKLVTAACLAYEFKPSFRVGDLRKQIKKIREYYVTNGLMCCCILDFQHVTIFIPNMSIQDPITFLKANTQIYKVPIEALEAL